MKFKGRCGHNYLPTSLDYFIPSVSALWRGLLTPRGCFLHFLQQTKSVFYTQHWCSDKIDKYQNPYDNFFLWVIPCQIQCDFLWVYFLLKIVFNNTWCLNVERICALTHVSNYLKIKTMTWETTGSAKFKETGEIWSCFICGEKCYNNELLTRLEYYIV